MIKSGHTYKIIILLIVSTLLLSGCVGILDALLEKAEEQSPLQATSAAIRAQASQVAVLPTITPQGFVPTLTPPAPTATIQPFRTATIQPTATVVAEMLTPQAVQNQPAADWWRVYFTDPGSEENIVQDRLIELINSAERSIHIASFEFNLDAVAEALIAAHQRGVEVQWVTDDEHGIDADEEEGHGQFWMLEEVGIEVVDDARSGLMHDKFWIFDNTIVWTGSTNITVNGTTRNNNNVIVIASPGLAEIYEREFQEMWTEGAHGTRSPSTIGQQGLRIEDTPVFVLFAAEDDVAAQLTALIEGAQFSVQFMAFSFTHDDIGAAMLERFNDGVDVTGIFETRGSETVYSEMTALACAGAEVRQDGNSRTFHHKVIIIDNYIVVTGSFNFSNNADKSNDENVLIIANPDIAELYMLEFERRWVEGQAPVIGDDINCP